MNKSDYYLTFPEKIYECQKEALLQNDGVYGDIMGGCTIGSPQLEEIDGVLYRRGTVCPNLVGPAYSYNSGTMISGAADLYRATSDDRYRTEGTALAEASFAYFADKGGDIPDYYTFSIAGFNNWFNGVLMRGYVDFYPAHQGTGEYIDAFQKNLAYGYENFLYDELLAANLLVGWNRDRNKNDPEGVHVEFAW